MIQGGDRGEASDAAHDTRKVPSGGCWEKLWRWEEKTGPHREHLPEGGRRADSGQTMGYPLCAPCTSPLVLLSPAGNAHQHLLDSLTTQGSLGPSKNKAKVKHVSGLHQVCFIPEINAFCHSNPAMCISNSTNFEPRLAGIQHLFKPS